MFVSSNYYYGYVSSYCCICVQVGVFLRLLEYHQGVLFLTTNRVKSFDSAFHSRIRSCLLKRTFFVCP